jgi:DNA-binding response OmpR family regulator
MNIVPATDLRPAISTSQLLAPVAAADRVRSTAISSRILVVDDDPGLRTMLKTVLGSAGYRISCAEDGEEGWHALCANRFDALITDHEMPRLTGLDLLRRVRARPLNVPVILTSGRIPWDQEDLTRLLPPGLALRKPFSFVELLACVRRILAPLEFTAAEDSAQGLRLSESGQPPPLGEGVAG